MLQLRWRIRQLGGILAVSWGISALVISISALGILQSLEWFAFDRFLRWKSTDQIDSRFLIVTLGEEDLRQIGEWPISDSKMASLLEQLQRHSPRLIGIDIYRDLPVGDGRDDLLIAFNTFSNVIGVEKVIGEAVPPVSGLDRDDQVAIADLVADKDGRIRRGLLAIQCNQEQQLCETEEHQQRKYGLGTKLALRYLEKEKITPKVLDEAHLQLGATVFRRFFPSDGGYAKADAHSTQILIDYPAGRTFFESVSFSDVLNGEISYDKIYDRIILVGATAVSLNDLLYTPMSWDERLPGVFIHAHIASQLIGGALGERQPLHGASPWIKTGWLLLSTSLAALLVNKVLDHNGVYKNKNLFSLLLVIPCVGSGLIAIVYAFFVAGLWLPIAAPLLSISLASTVLLLRQNHQLQGLASLDGLTRIANRRSFDTYLQRCIQQQTSLALVLCDVDYFKRYNDTYGHQEGDRCLISVAKTLQQGVRHSDFVARYGGEEFVIVLPNTELPVAFEVLGNIQRQVAKLKIPHVASDVSDYVTLSFGVIAPKSLREATSKSLVEQADKALYQAKNKGRNQIAAGA
ncbi:MAG: CHASE2 domain-containing protein [Cyanobacteria bacterium P01_D01_bin.156]